MQENLRPKDWYVLLDPLTEDVTIGMETWMGAVPILWFKYWKEFELFLEMLERFKVRVEDGKNPIPDVFKKVIREYLNKNGNDKED